MCAGANQNFIALLSQSQWPLYWISDRPDSLRSRCTALIETWIQEAWRDKPIDGPSSWEEVDTEELARIALHICSNTVPSTDHAEAASRLAMQAASLDTDTLDLLALGRIDTRQLRLVSLSL